MCQENDKDDSHMKNNLIYLKKQNEFQFQTNISISFDIANPFFFLK